MTAPVPSRPAPPPLEHPVPPCSLCGEETVYDDGFYCLDCEASWDSDLSHLDGYSSWDDPAAEQCPATVRPWAGSTRYPALADTVWRCLLSTGHAGDRHCNGEGNSWTDTETDGHLLSPTERRTLNQALIQQHAGEQERAARVRQLHPPVELPGAQLICAHCSVPGRPVEFPCPTILALDS